MKKTILLFLGALIPLYVSAMKVVHDTPDVELHRLFGAGKAKYIIHHEHHFNDTISIPEGSVLMFDGGSLNGPIKFNHTSLKGNVNLKGSTISGVIANKFFDASWLCAMDGVTDDAMAINQMIEVCGSAFFPKGKYRLISAYDASGKVSKECLQSIQAHIGIHQSNVSLIGEDGTIFETDKPLGCVCVFSKPNMIAQSIRNINIENITFITHNDGKNFHEFMHAIKLIGVNGITIRNCTINDFLGDGICLSHYGDNPQTGERTRNQNVKVLSNIIVGGDHHNNRNGISVINGKDVLIKGNTIKNTSRKDMPGGIDIEPNNSAYTIENIKVINNTLDGIQGGGGAIGLCVFDGGPAHGITIKGNRISNSVKGIQLYIKTEGTTSGIVIKNNYVSADTRPYSFVGAGSSKDWIIRNNIFERPCKQDIPGDIQVDNLVLKNNKKKDN